MTGLSCDAQNSQFVEDVPSPGALNAIKKAYQMTDLRFTPIDSFVANPGKTYYGGKEYQGLVYSSVKEMHSFVGMDVSFHTFMTALHNPRSVMYTENVSKPPYHGSNCGAYYGTVCSGLTTYAFGLNVYLKSYDFAHSDLFKYVDNQPIDSIQLADVINSGGHVQLVTKIKRNKHGGKIVEIELCESVRPGCRRVILSGDKLNQLKNLHKRRKRKIYRYKYLDRVQYEPLTQFVAVGNEKLTPHKYNDDICTSRGDKACYTEGDSVILNVGKGYEYVEVYKNSNLYKESVVDKNNDVIIKNLPYGDYTARGVSSNKKSDFTSWKVIDADVRIDNKHGIVSFFSSNARPVYIEFCSTSGGRPTSGVFELTEEDINDGYVNVTRYTSTQNIKMLRKRYVKVHFECDYGRVTNRPIKWI